MLTTALGKDADILLVFLKQNALLGWFPRASTIYFRINASALGCVVWREFIGVAKDQGSPVKGRHKPFDRIAKGKQYDRTVAIVTATIESFWNIAWIWVTLVHVQVPVSP